MRRLVEIVMTDEWEEKYQQIWTEREDHAMTPNRVDESANSDGREGWHCPDCQSWGPFTVNVTRRVMLREDGTPFLDEEGDTDDYTAFAMCEVCQRQAPVSSFRFEGALMDDPERHVRAGWTQQGVDHATPD